MSCADSPGRLLWPPRRQAPPPGNLVTAPCTRSRESPHPATCCLHRHAAAQQRRAAPGGGAQPVRQQTLAGEVQVQGAGQASACRQPSATAPVTRRRTNRSCTLPSAPPAHHSVVVQRAAAVWGGHLQASRAKRQGLGPTHQQVRTAGWQAHQQTVAAAVLRWHPCLAPQECRRRRGGVGPHLEPRKHRGQLAILGGVADPPLDGAVVGGLPRCREGREWAAWHASSAAKACSPVACLPGSAAVPGILRAAHACTYSPAGPFVPGPAWTPSRPRPVNPHIHNPLVCVHIKDRLGLQPRHVAAVLQLRHRKAACVVA